MSTYCLLSPGDSCEHSTGLPYLHVTHISRAPGLSGTACTVGIFPRYRIIAALGGNLTGGVRITQRTPRMMLTLLSVPSCGPCAHRSGYPSRCVPYTPAPPLPGASPRTWTHTSLHYRVHQEEVTEFTSTWTSQTYRKIMSGCWRQWKGPE